MYAPRMAKGPRPSSPSATAEPHHDQNQRGLLSDMSFLNEDPWAFTPFYEYQRWAKSAEGRAKLAKYPQVIDMDEEQKQSHKEFVEYLLARFGDGGE